MKSPSSPTTLSQMKDFFESVIHIDSSDFRYV